MRGPERTYILILMVKSLLELLYSDTGKDTAVVFAGTLTNVIVGGLFFVVVPRILGPSDYGLFSTVVATALMVTAIANFGLDTGILRFAKTNPSIITTALKTYIVLGTSAAILGFILAPFISQLLNSPQISPLLQIAFLGTIFLLLSNFFVAALQAKSEFTKASLVGIASNVLRLIILLIAIWFFKVNLYFLTALFFFIPIASIILGNFFLPIKFEKTKNTGNFFKYNFWIGSALIVSSIPFDNYFLLTLAGPVATGLYFAPFKILTFAYQFGGNFTRVLASRYASFDTQEKALEFSKKSLLFPLIFSFGLFLLGFIAQPLISIIFGPEYQESVNIMQILTLGFIAFFLSTIPSSLILYFFGKSSISFLITVIRYVFFVSLLILLVPASKAQGAAWAFTASEWLSLLVLSGYCLAKFKKND